MIIANIKNSDRYINVMDCFKEVFDFLKNLDETADVGAFEFDTFKGSISELQTSDTDANGNPKVFEVHRDYLDIHYCISGKEGIGLANIDSLIPTTEYNKEGDYQLLKGDMNKYILSPGDFCVVFPEDAHAPGMCGGDDNKLKKVVVKVKVS